MNWPKDGSGSLVWLIKDGPQGKDSSKRIVFFSGVGCLVNRLEHIRILRIRVE